VATHSTVALYQTLQYHKMSFKRMGCMLSLIGSSALVEGGEQKIKHVVVLMEENRPFDHIFGWRKDVNGLTGTEYNLLDPFDSSSQKIYVNSSCPYINDCDPGMK
jgi:phospholipase C